MIKPPSSSPPAPGPGASADQVARTAWREQILAQVLDKVRQQGLQASQSEPASSPRPPGKGGLVDLYV